MIKAVMFDHGKVISHAPNTTTRHDIASAFGVSDEDTGKAIGKYIGDFRKGILTEDSFWEKMASEFGKPVPENKYELWRADFRKKLEIFDDMLDFVRYLKSKGLKVGVISNNITPYVEIINERDGFKDFDIVINSCEVGFSKPEEGIFKLALDKLNLPPQEVLFVDDRQENIDTAKRMGMVTLLATDLTKLREDIKEVLNN